MSKFGFVLRRVALEQKAKEKALEERKRLSEARLRIALSLLSTKQGDTRFKQVAIQGICEADPLVKKILETYGYKS